MDRLPATAASRPGASTHGVTVSRVHGILEGSTLAASFLGGMVALFAPCCISVMLPAYFASSFRRRRALVAMTFVFAAGVASVILPIAFGATGVSRLIAGNHLPVFLAGGVLMLAMGVATLAGWSPRLPMIGMRASANRGALSVYGLGAFSGIASACCAPVLAGVVALSGAAESFVVALGIGVAYVFGMVLPLFLIALLWDHRDWGTSPLLRGRTVTIRVVGRARALTVAALASGVLLLAMGALVVAVAVTGPAMSTTGWQANLGAQLDHLASQATHALSHLPGWVVGLLLVAGLAGLGWKALGQFAPPRSRRTADPSPSLPPEGEVT